MTINTKIQKKRRNNIKKARVPASILCGSEGGVERVDDGSWSWDGIGLGGREGPKSAVAALLNYHTAAILGSEAKKKLCMAITVSLFPCTT